jgi:hypothetical protein
MTEGISLDIDSEGELNIAEPNDPKQECFGGVMCIYCTHRSETIKLQDGSEIKTTPMWCTKVDRSVVDIFYDSINARCPLDLWIKAAVPKYYNGSGKTK